MKTLQKIVGVVAVLVTTIVSAQTQTENYVKTTTYQTEVQEGQQPQVLESDKIVTVGYSDGLGRTKQSVAVRGGGQKQDTNILDWKDDWTVGIGPTPLFNRCGKVTENERIFGNNPFGEQSLLWKCVNDADRDADGGWNTDYFAIDKNVGYRYIVWVKRTGSQDGTTYHGTQNVNNLNGTANNNPYFWYGDLPNLDTWYLLVGIVHPFTYTGGNSGISGVYDINGNKVKNANDFKWRSNTTTSRFRSYLYYSTDVNTSQYFWNPVITKINGNGEAISQLIEQSKPKDIVAHYEYDEFGKQTKSYLPYASDQTENGAIHTDALSALKSFYNTSKYENTLNPYSETITEASPANRVYEQAAPGGPWGYDKENIQYKNPVYTSYPTNVTFNKRWAAKGIFYVPGQGTPPDETIITNPLLSNSYLWLYFDAGKLKLRIKTSTADGLKKLATGKLRKLDVVPAIEYLDMGYIKDAAGNNTDYKIAIEDNYVVVTAINQSPRLINAGINTSSDHNLNQLQVLTGYDEIYSTNTTTKAAYGLNTNAEVHRFDVVMLNGNSQTPLLVSNGTYAAGQLTKNITKNENWTIDDGDDKTAETFTDKNGNIVLSRGYNNSVAHDTYNVYDDFGNLTYVIPPKVTVSNGVSNTELSELCYQYKYDDQNRLIEKKIPGKGWEYIVYNKLNQPVMTQDANQRAKSPKEWLFTKYDEFGRVAFTGELKNNASRVSLQNSANSNAYTQSVSKRTSPLSLAGTPVYYTNDAIPHVFTQILTIHYYDDYTFDRDGMDKPTSVLGVATTNATKGLPTGSKVRVLGTNSWITSVIAYDQRGRNIWGGSRNRYLNTIDKSETQLDFVGKTLMVKTTHNKDSNPAIVNTDTFTYDHMGRLLTQKQIINNQPEELLAKLEYDDLGQLIQKKVGNAEQAPLQTIDYTYNVRGWITKINDPSALGDDLFGYKVNYNKPTHGATSLYNGNISEVEWKSASDNALRWYKYTYDDMDRITSALDNTNRYNLNFVHYDKNGNITALRRQGNRNAQATSFGTMDNLTYSYDVGNKLNKVTDTGFASFGFKDGTNTNNDYEYDANGNIIIDRNKGISGIQYNYLDLPGTISFTSSSVKEIDYKYDATGVKIGKEVIDEVTDMETRTEYAGNYVYENGQLKFFNHSEGYIEPESNGTFTYIYQYKDHLGNNRLNYADKDKDGQIDVLRNNTDVDGDGDYAREILQENNYYPFGLQHKGYNSQITGQEHQYKYNGTELTEELGLNWYEMPLRSYDPAIARWNRIDPVIHFSLSTYNAFDNNPVVYADPSGGNSEYSHMDDQIFSEGRHVGVQERRAMGGSGYGGSTPYDYATTQGNEMMGVMQFLVSIQSVDNNSKKEKWVADASGINHSITAEEFNGDIDAAYTNMFGGSPEDFVGRISRNMNGPIVLTLRDLGETIATGNFSYTFNNKTNQYDIIMDFVVSYSQSFRIAGANGLTVEQENPGLFKAVRGHEELGHVEQYLDAARNFIISNYNVNINGTVNTFSGTADRILTDVRNSFLSGSQNQTALNNLIQQTFSNLIINHLDAGIRNSVNVSESDANSRAINSGIPAGYLNGSNPVFWQGVQRH
ncbi:hypothetical protein J8L88_06905 [Aquimarina sp. MMG015]|uniref:DUF6443 domain-containing protein n=1 Tax=Aquimarina sp. MMG015 TaxID=2822689 RepID=UPI001B3A64F1|nr:DUF6443 domain-containing protein [Aquimarina sp. MMG015]MBQ4802582.1 hypothetical protein [Aquimarina sp. MMG015]